MTTETIHTATKLQYIATKTRLFAICTKLDRYDSDFEKGYGVAKLSYGAGIFSADEDNKTPSWTKKIRKRLSQTACGRLKKAPVVKFVVWCREDVHKNTDTKEFCNRMFNFKMTDVSKLLVLSNSKAPPIFRSFIGRFGVSGFRTNDVYYTTEKIINLKKEIEKAELKLE